MFWRASLAGLLLIAAATAGARAGPGEKLFLPGPHAALPHTVEVQFGQPLFPMPDGDTVWLTRGFGGNFAEHCGPTLEAPTVMVRLGEVPEPQAGPEPEEAWFDPSKLGWSIVHLLIEGILAAARFLGRREGIPV